MLGSGAMTNSIEDVVNEADVIMLVGSNPEEAHPVIGMQIRAAVERGCRLIVVDPRDIGLAAQADIHLKLRPGTNVAFANCMVNVILREGLYDADFVHERTEGVEIMSATVRDYVPERVEDICGVDQRDLVAAAKMYGKARVAAIVYCLGVTEHSTGTDGVMALSNIAMITGNLGKRGGGVNPLRGQNNVQGACDMGAGPDDLPGYQKVADPEVVRRFERAWGTGLPRERGVKATECFPSMIEGGIKGLFLFGEDPVRTDPDTGHVIRALESLDFFVVDDLFMTETAKYADVILPGCSYAEKEGTFTNTERRVQRVRKAVDVLAFPLLSPYSQHPPLTSTFILIPPFHPPSSHHYSYSTYPPPPPPPLIHLPTSPILLPFFPKSYFLLNPNSYPYPLSPTFTPPHHHISSKTPFIFTNTTPLTPPQPYSHPHPFIPLNITPPPPHLSTTIPPHPLQYPPSPHPLPFYPSLSSPKTPNPPLNPPPSLSPLFKFLYPLLFTISLNPYSTIYSPLYGRRACRARPTRAKRGCRSISRTATATG